MSTEHTELRAQEPMQLRISEMRADRPHVVIIGGGFGGLQTALHLGNAPVHVTVIDRTNHHLFQPLLYQVATATLSPGEISAPIRHVLHKQQHTDVMLAEVTGVDPEQQRVLLHNRSLHYDYLVIATGASENYFGHEEWRTFAPGLKSIEDAREIRQKILLAFEQAELESDPQLVQELLTFVVIGAGPTGVELAGDIAEVAHKVLKAEFRHIDPSMTRIILVEAGPRILPAFPEALAHSAEQKLRRLGVEVRTNAPASDINESGVVVHGERIATQTMFWTAGVLASPAAKWLHAEADRAGRVKVRANLSVPGHPNIFVIGDTASYIQNGKPLPGVAPVAMQQGRYIARLLAQRVSGKNSVGAFRYIDKGSLATIGRGFAIVKLGKLQLSGFLAWVIWMAVHIFYLIGFENRVLVMLQWAWAYLAFQRRVRLITQIGKWAIPVSVQDATKAKHATPAMVSEPGEQKFTAQDFAARDASKTIESGSR